jgi:hypothetical protein
MLERVNVKTGIRLFIAARLSAGWSAAGVKRGAFIGGTVQRLGDGWRGSSSARCHLPVLGYLAGSGMETFRGSSVKNATAVRELGLAGNWRRREVTKCH